MASDDKAVAMIWYVGGRFFLRVGTVEFDKSEQEFVVRVPVAQPAKHRVSAFSTLKDAVNQDRVVLLRLMKHLFVQAAKLKGQK